MSTSDKWDGKSKGTPLGYQIFIFIISKLGVKAAYLMLYPVVTYYYFFSKTSNKALKQYILQAQAYGISDVSRFQIYLNFAKVLVDKFAVKAGLSKQYSFSTDGFHYLEQLAAEKKGAVLISGHIGNWELAAQEFDKFEAQIHIVMYDEEHQALKEKMQAMYGEIPYQIIAIKDSFSHIYAIHEALEAGGLICLHGDRFRKEARSMEGLFLGKKALFPQGPFVVAEKFKVPVVFVFGALERDFHYGLSCTPPLTGLSKEVYFEKYLEVFQEKVKKHPNQWYNFYTFWE